MQQQTNDANLSLPGVKTRGSRGRKDHDGVEETIKIQPIKDGAADVMKLVRKAENAKTLVNEAYKALAERAGVNVTSLKKLFKASYKGNFEDVRRDIDQQSALFESVGEIAGGKPAADA